MGTERQNDANRRNAKKSTGPRTGQGHARSSQNARKHGLRAPLDVSQTLLWARIILNNPEIGLEVLGATDTRIRLALALAEAEADLERVRDALAAREGKSAKLHSPEAPKFTWHGAFESFDDPETLKTYAAHFDNPEGLRRAVLSEAARETRVLKAYRKIAEGRHRRALKAWLGFLKSEKQSEIDKRSQVHV